MQGLSRASAATLIVAGLVALTGLVFIGQGLGIITGGSVMVGDRTWAVIGAVVVIAAAWVAWRTWGRRAR
ncbi:MAG TPA: hypothetical protein VF323_14210 [Candidatus Limnocylindrales bacterium]